MKSNAGQARTVQAADETSNRDADDERVSVDQDCWKPHGAESTAALDFRRHLVSESLAFQREYPKSALRTVSYPVCIDRESRLTTNTRERAELKASVAFLQAELIDLKKQTEEIARQLVPMRKMLMDTTSLIRMRVLRLAWRYGPHLKAAPGEETEIKVEGDRAAHGPDIEADYHCITYLEKEARPDWGRWKKRAAKLYGCRWGHLRMLTDPVATFGLSEEAVILPSALEQSLCRLYWTYHFILWTARVDPTSGLRDYVSEQMYGSPDQSIPELISLQYLPCLDNVATDLKVSAGRPGITMDECEEAANQAVGAFLQPYFEYNTALVASEEETAATVKSPMTAETMNLIMLFVRLVKEAYMGGFQRANIAYVRSDNKTWNAVEALDPLILYQFRRT